MSDFVGVIPALAFNKPNELKRLLLMFERLALDLSAQRLSVPEKDAIRIGKKTLDLLNSEGWLTTLDGARADARGNKPRHFADPEHAEVLNIKGIGRAFAMSAGRMNPQTVTAKENLRQTALRLRSQGFDAIAVGDEKAISVDAKAKRDHVIRVTINALPVPTEATPWQAIGNFKRDPESRSKHARLKAWINAVAQQQPKVHVLQDDLREQLFEYEQFMKYHEIKAKSETVQVLLVAPSASDGGHLTTADFSAARQEAGLLEAEMKAPGRSVAYIVKARHEFSPNR